MVVGGLVAGASLTAAPRPPVTPQSGTLALPRGQSQFVSGSGLCYTNNGTERSCEPPRIHRQLVKFAVHSYKTYFEKFY